MPSNIEILQQRRGELVRRAAAQRQALLEEIQYLDAPLRVAEKTIQVSYLVRRYSWVLIFGGATVLGAWLFRKSPEPAQSQAKTQAKPKGSTLASLWKGARLVYTFWQTIRHF